MLVRLFVIFFLAAAAGPGSESGSAEPPLLLVLAVDTSAAEPHEFGAFRRELAEFIGTRRSRDKVAVLACRRTVEEVTPLSSIARSELFLPAIHRLVPTNASRLGPCLAKALAIAQTNREEGRDERVVLVTAKSRVPPDEALPRLLHPDVRRGIAADVVFAGSGLAARITNALGGGGAQ